MGSRGKLSHSELATAGCPIPGSWDFLWQHNNLPPTNLFWFPYPKQSSFSSTTWFARKFVFAVLEKNRNLSRTSGKHPQASKNSQSLFLSNCIICQYLLPLSFKLSLCKTVAIGVRWCQWPMPSTSHRRSRSPGYLSKYFWQAEQDK